MRAQRLTADRPTDVHETVHDLWALLLNPTSTIAPSADLVLWSRIGSAYDPRELEDALDGLDDDTDDGDAGPQRRAS